MPVRHAFTHRAYQWLVDVDDLPVLPRWLRPLARFDPADHLDAGASGGGLRGDLEHFLGQRGVRLDPSDRVVMLANARVLGHVFDPLTVWWVVRTDGGLRAVVFEVHNTYRERHAYLLDVDDRGRAETDKRFYVSPFNDVSGRYEIRLRAEPRIISVSIGLDREDDRVLTAVSRGVPEPATPRSLLRVSATHLLMTQRVTALIRLHGVRLWLRRLPVRPRPPAPTALRQPGGRGSGGRSDSGRLGPRARIARALVRMATERVGVDVVLPDGSLLGRRSTADGPAGGRPRIDLHRPEALYRALARDPKIAIGESYSRGDWSAAADTDLADVLAPFAARLTSALPGWVMRLRRVADRAIPTDQRGAVEDTQDNIAAHYDLSNDLFASFLDPTLSYSSALFDPARPREEQDLEEAQLRKVSAALDRAGVGVGTSLLEIGTGWGTLAIEAARRGARVTTATLSLEQATLARERIEAAGLADRIDVVVQDYRQLHGEYDAIVSVEMIEAVGERYWPEFFATLRRRLRPGGAIALQAILMSHERYLATRHSYGWIQKHIFPGGLIPSTTAIAQHAAAAGLRIDEEHDFGADYAETLRRWRHAFTDGWPIRRPAHAPDVDSLIRPATRPGDFDEDFRRTWEFYLAYCEAGFRTGYLDVAQLRLVGGP